MNTKPGDVVIAKDLDGTEWEGTVTGHWTTARGTRFALVLPFESLFGHAILCDEDALSPSLRQVVTELLP